jgi:hypothetical protein
VSTLIFIQEEVSTQVGKLQNGFNVEININPFNDRGEAHTLTQMAYLLNEKIEERVQYLETNGVPKGATEHKLIKRLLEANKQHKLLTYASSHPGATQILKDYREAQQKVKKELSASTSTLDKVLTQPVIDEESLTVIVSDYSQISKGENKDFTKRLQSTLSKTFKSVDKSMPGKIEANAAELSNNDGNVFTYKKLMDTAMDNGHFAFNKYDNSSTPPKVERFNLVKVLTKATGMNDDKIKKILGHFLICNIRAHVKSNGVTSIDVDQLKRPPPRYNTKGHGKPPSNKGGGRGK